MTETIYVYKNKTGATEPLRATQGESGAHTYVFKVLNENDNVVSLAGAVAASFYVQRPDKVIVESPCVVSGWEVTCTPAIGSYLVAGTCRCFLQIIGDSVSPTTDQRFSGISLLVKGETLSGSTGAGVTSVNGKTGDVVLNFSDIGEDGKDWIKDAGDKAIAELMNQKSAEFDQYLKLLQNIDFSENKAAYLAFLSKAAVPSDVKLYNASAYNYLLPPSGTNYGENIRLDSSNWFNQSSSAISISDSTYTGDGDIGLEYWKRLTGSGDILISVGFECTYDFTNLSTSGPYVVSLRLMTHLASAAPSARTTVLTRSFSVGTSTQKIGTMSLTIPRVKLRISEATDLAVNLYVNDAQLANTRTLSFLQTAGGTYWDIQVLPDLTRFPTGAQPTIIDTGEIQQVIDGVADAKSAALTAETAAVTASDAATSAASSAAGIGAAEANASASASASESWAIGGTGTRPGEDTDNAKYWSKLAENIAGGGVTAFNGRSGNVIPQAGDYTAADVGADPEGLAAAVQGNLDLHAYNTTLHLDNTERDAWNAKLDESKIQLTQNAPEAGDISSFPDGTLLLVYEVG